MSHDNIKKRLESKLQSKYHIVLGENNLERLAHKLNTASISVTGRCASSGEKKTVNVLIKDLV